MQRAAGNATAVASMGTAVPVQRISACVTTPSNESQVLADALRERYGLSSDPSKVQPGEVLYIIGHGSEIGSGESAARKVLYAGFRPGYGREVRLVVCSAGRRPADRHSSPAQTIANFLQTPVLASTTLVRHVPGEGWGIIEGDCVRFRPQRPVEDITSRMRHLSVRDPDPVDDVTADMRYMTLNPSGWSSGGGGRGCSAIDREGVTGSPMAWGTCPSAMTRTAPGTTRAGPPGGATTRTTERFSRAGQGRGAGRGGPDGVAGPPFFVSGLGGTEHGALRAFPGSMY
ncbi:hypothetical protein [Streptomyces carpaticus]|uniref:Uncharacterized protein n=1 Tax=Streptomyces carpaticus TaxID=285558 RepID=A0ABV4ZH90_9ACTN